MRDINFFSTYQSKYEEHSDILKHLNKVLILFAIVVGSTLGINTMRLFWYNHQISSVQAKIDDTSFNAKYIQASKVSKEIEILNQYDSKVKDLANSINNKNNVSYDLLIQLSSVVPSEVSYKSIQIQSNEVSIQGNSTSSDAVAELLHNLKELENVEEAFVSSIDGGSSVEGQYSFGIKCVLKDVM